MWDDQRSSPGQSGPYPQTGNEGWNSAGPPGNISPIEQDGRRDDFLRRYENIFQEPQAPQPLQGYPPAPPQPPKKQKKARKGGGGIGLIVVLGVILSGLSGFAGGYGALLYFEENKPPASSYVEETAPPSSQSPLDTASSISNTSIANIAKVAAPSVVEITTEVVTTNPYFGQFITGGAGSGVIISSDGYIVTNHHVIADARKITVRLPNGKYYPATLVGSDTGADIAIIKIGATDLPAATFGDSDTLQVGDFALAIGNPLGELGGTVTNGIISALGRPLTVDGRNMTLLQTNAAINSGNSGGGLFNERGELIGIVNAKSMGSGIEGLGFAIPINTAKPVIYDLMNGGQVQGRPYLGIVPIDISDARTAMNYHVQYLGVYVSAVEKNSSAESGGIQVGDFILKVGSQDISTSEHLATAINAKAVGDSVEIQIMRDSRTINLTVVLKERPAGT